MDKFVVEPRTELMISLAILSSSSVKVKYPELGLDDPEAGTETRGFWTLLLVTGVASGSTLVMASNSSSSTIEIERRRLPKSRGGCCIPWGS